MVQNLQATVEKQYSSPVMVFHLDHGGKFTLGTFNSFCEDTEIKHQLTAP